jgi:MOSC domain-containing protein YiiM
MIKSDMQTLIETLPQVGRVDWIGLRPERREALESVSEANITLEDGLVGDHYSGRNKRRQVTLIQTEHLQGVAHMLGRELVDPQLTRRNIVVSGINLLAFKDRRFRIGTAILEMTGPCEPCSRMEENLGPGGYNAMRGHGGITARVIQGGQVKVGDEVRLES